MKYFFEVYGLRKYANEYLSNDPLNHSVTESIHYLAIDQISEISGNRVTMANGNLYELDDYNMDKLKKFMYHHECIFTDTLGHSWQPSMPMTEDR